MQRSAGVGCEVSLVCVCQGKSNLANKFIFSDSVLDFACRNFFIRKSKGEMAKHIKHPSSFHGWKFPVTWHYKLNQLSDLPLSCAPCKRSANINSKPLWAINLCTIIVAPSLSSLRYLLEENKNFIVDRDIPSETITAWASSAVSNLWRLTSH